MKAKNDGNIRQSLAEARLQLVLNMTDLWIWEVDHHGLYTYISHSIESVLGYRMDEVIGKKYFYDFLAPLNKEELKEKSFAVISSMVEFKDVEYLCAHKDGHEVYFEISGVPMFDDDGIFAGYRGTAKNISIQKYTVVDLVDSEENLRNFFESTSDFLFVANMDGKILATNSVVQNRLGYSLNELEGMPLIHLNGFTNIADAEPILQDLLSGKRPYCPLPLYTKDGQMIPVNSYAWKGKWNREECIFGSSRDISTEIETQQRFERFFNLNPALMAVSDAETQLFTNVNKTFLDKLGYEREEVIGRNTSELNLFPQPEKQIEAGKQLKANGNIKNIELQVKCKNGDIIDGIFFGHYIINHGRKYFLTVMVDITQRNQALKEVERLQHFYEKLIRNAPDGIALIDKARYCVYLSPAGRSILGLDDDELPDFIDKKLIHPDDFLNLKNALDNLQASSDERSEIEFRFLCRGNEWRTIMGTLTNRLADPSIRAIIFNFRDTTEEKVRHEELLAAKDKAEASSRLKSNFLANMSHELRTPLIGILGYSEILIDSTDSSVQESASIIHKSGRRLLETLNLILDLARIEADKLAIELQEFDLISLASNVHELFRETAKQKALDFKLVTEFKSLKFKSNSMMTEQIIINLVNNALKFTNHGEVTVLIEISEVEKKEYAKISVSDSGIGIAGQNLELIWEDFRQISEGLSRNYEGSGLGLTITKRFTEKLGGVIKVESVLHVGTTFSVFLPLNNWEGEYSADFEGQTLYAEDNMSNHLFKETILPTVLYLEDDPIAANLASFFLKGVCNVEWVTESNEALSMASSKEYDAVLLDISIAQNKLDGMAVAKLLKQHSGYDKVPIIALTAHAMKGDRERFLGAGCTHYLTKPYSKTDLEDLLTSLFSD